MSRIFLPGDLVRTNGAGGSGGPGVVVATEGDRVEVVWYTADGDGHPTRFHGVHTHAPGGLSLLEGVSGGSRGEELAAWLARVFRNAEQTAREDEAELEELQARAQRLRRSIDKAHEDARAAAQLLNNHRSCGSRPEERP